MRKCELKIPDSPYNLPSVEEVEAAGGFDDRSWMLDFLMKDETGDWADVLGQSNEELADRIKAGLQLLRPRPQFKSQLKSVNQVRRGNRVAHILAECDPDGEGVHVGDLADCLGVTRSAAESASQRLIEKGFVERVSPGRVKLIASVEEVDAVCCSPSNSWDRAPKIPGTNKYVVRDPDTGTRFTYAPIALLQLLADHDHATWEEVESCFGENRISRIVRDIKKIEQYITVAWENGKGIIAEQKGCRKLLDHLGVPQQKKEINRGDGDDRCVVSPVQTGLAFPAGTLLGSDGLGKLSHKVGLRLDDSTWERVQQYCEMLQGVFPGIGHTVVLRELVLIGLRCVEEER